MIMLTYFLSSNLSTIFFEKVYGNKFCNYLMLSWLIFPSSLTRRLIACCHSTLVYTDYMCDVKDFTYHLIAICFVDKVCYSKSSK